MKSGGPWNFAGLRPQAREPARPSSVSVGDWLNSVIKTDAEAQSADDAAPRPFPPESRQQHNDRKDRETKPRYEGRPYRDQPRNEDAGPLRDRDERQRHDSNRLPPAAESRSDAAASDAAREAAIRKVEDAAREAAREAEQTQRPEAVSGADREEARRLDAARDVAREEARREAAMRGAEETRRREAEEAHRLDAAREAAREEARREAALREAEEARRRETIREEQEARNLEAAREAAREEARREAAFREAEEARRRETIRAAEEARNLEAAREVAREEARRETALREAEEARRRDAAREEAAREAAHARDGLGEMHSRLDKLTAQIEHLARIGGARQRAAAAPTAAAALERKPRLTGAPQRHRAASEPVISIDDALAEIAARQRALENVAGGFGATVPAASSGRAVEREAAGSGAAAAPEHAAPLAPLMPSPAPGREPAAPVAAMGSGAVLAVAPLRDVLPDAKTHGPNPASAAGPAVDFSGLEKQLREIMARIEVLRPANDIDKVIAALRTDLAEIGRQFSDALPRRAVESLEIEIKALAERIDHSRQSGVDGNALAGLERGLAEVREAVRALTPAENLVGFNEAVNALSQKVDSILAKDDPSALQQLEAAIGGLRGVVSHVASNDTLTRVAEDVRALAGQIDGIANSAATGHAVSALEHRLDTLAAALTASSEAGQSAAGQAVSAIEQRIDTLAAALTASSEAGQSVPRDLEKLLAGLIEKLEWVQLTHTDHAALAHLEDRIATLVQRFDASDARLGHLEAIERGLADLLVHIEELRGSAGALFAQPAANAFERDVAEIKQRERRNQESLEAVQGTVEHVVDRLATLESGLRVDTRIPVSPEPAAAVAPASPSAAAEPVAAAEPQPAPPLAPEPASAEPAPRASTTRTPIDPTLPPDHPLEPGSAQNRSRPGTSAAERIAASEAAIGAAKPPIIPDAERPNFIAAARRAAQAAAWEDPGQNAKVQSSASTAAQPNKLSQRLRKLIVAGSVLLILVGCLRIATRLYEDSGSASVPPAQPARSQSEQVSPPVGPPQSILPPNVPRPEALPAPPPTDSAPNEPARQPPAANVSKPQRQSAASENDVVAAAGTAPGRDQPVAGPALPAWAAPDITGAIAGREVEPDIAPPSEHAALPGGDKLPATIGDPALRAAAMAGDPAAAYEVATRFADGRGVLQNNEEAARWLQRAADKGLAPAQFRLGGLYEKGIGVKKDLVTARDLYLAAAEKGNGKAMHNLAVLYAEGAGGAPDYNKAAEWFRKAAEHGIRDSQYNLGILYARGIGVAKNDAESYKWFAIAANQGDKEAAKKRDEIASHLDAPSLAAARLAVQKWTPQSQPDDAVNVPLAPAWSSTAKASRSSKQK